MTENVPYLARRHRSHLVRPRWVWGGLILALAEDFPKTGQTFHMPPYTFTIQSTLDNRIGTVKVTLEKAEETA